MINVCKIFNKLINTEEIVMKNLLSNVSKSFSSFPKTFKKTK